MIAIRVRYCPATNHRGSRLVVTDGRHRLSVPYEYGNDDHEKLNPTPSQFNGDCYFSFYPKADPEKLEELLSQYSSTYGVSNPVMIEVIRMFVKQNCILK